MTTTLVGVSLGFCWSSLPHEDYSFYAYYMLFGSGGDGWGSIDWRGYGRSVRPVSE